MDSFAFEHHLLSPQGRGRIPAGSPTVQVGGMDCCDEIRLGLVLDEGVVTDMGFEARGCGASTAAASAAVTLTRGRPLADAARVGTEQIASELGGLSPAKRHAADLAADALGRALGEAIRQSPVQPLRECTLVALSGGVDSAVAALLSAQSGEALTVTLELWSDRENDGERSCCSASAVAQARELAHSLGLPHLTLDLRDEFRAGVVEPFIAGYAAGQTPNPCVGCNGHVRLDAMLDLADRLGCRWLATGHYARIAPARHGAQAPLLRLAADGAKDQTYMLAALSPDSLARMRFPLGELTKPEVRALAAAAGLSVASKVESQDLCFLAGTSRPRFLARHGAIPDKPGEIVDENGTLLGHHTGQHNFTVGQRRGLRVASTEPLFVLEKDAGTNRVRVGPRAALATDRVALRGVQLHRPGERVDRVKLRYRSRPLPCRLTHALPPGRHGRAAVALGEPAAAAAPGQVACLMEGDLVLGWATIA